MAREFRGKIELDVRDSVSDWDAFLPGKAPEGAPNVLVVLYDDTGQAAWSPYGGRINMPTMDRLAADGLTYSQWHTTALCSPTRSTFLTGRNHHLNGFASISESSTGFPGYSSHIPPSNATMANVLREAGWSTFWVGKNHNIPIDEWTAGASKKRWPLGQGYDRFYGFIGGETNNWYPVAGRGQPLHRAAVPARGRLPPVQGPGRPGAADDPRLQADRARQALVPVVLPRRQPRAAPRAAGVHRQVQGRLRRRLRGVPRVGAAADDRARHPARGHRADAAQPDARGHLRRGGLRAAVGGAERRRRRGCSAGWQRCTPGSRSTPTPRSAGSSTTSRSPASSRTRSSSTAPTTAPRARAARTARSTRASSSTAIPTPSRTTWPMMDELGSPDTYNHYPTGWAAAFSTPYRMFKRYTYQGGVCDPLVIHWPKGIRAQGRGARTSTTTAPTSSRHPRGLRRDHARRRRRRRADPAVRASRCSTPSTTPRRRRRRRRSTTRCSATVASGTRAGRPSPSTARSAGMSNFDQDTLAALPHRRRPGRGARPRRRAPGEAPGAGRPVVRGGQGQQRAAAQRHAGRRQGPRGVLGDGVQRPGAAERPVHLLPRHLRGPGALGRQRPRACPTRSSPRSSSPPRRAA